MTLLPKGLMVRARKFVPAIIAGLTLALGLAAAPGMAQAQAVTISDVSQVEGNAGTSNMIFTATLDTSVPGGFTVNYATANGTALSGSDYVAAAGTLTFAGIASESQSFTVTINGDTTFEPNETFAVSINTVSVPFVNITDTAVGTITNDDAAPAPVPTLTEWAMILLGLTLAGFAALTLQCRRMI